MSRRARETDDVPAAKNLRAGSGMGKFGVIWFGFLVSFLGTSMARFAIGIQVFLDSESVTRFALVPLSAALPLLLLSPIAGALADRFDRRLLLLCGVFGASLPQLFLWHLITTDRLEPWHIYPLIAAGASFGAFIGPSLRAMVPLLIGKQHFARASGLLQTGMSLSGVLGPLLGGALLPLIGLANVILINVSSFLVAVVSLLAIRLPRASRADSAQPSAVPAAVSASDIGAANDNASAVARTSAPADRRFSAGWRFIRQHPGLLRLLLVVALVNFFVGVMQVLLAPLVLTFATPTVLGMVMSLASSGALVGGAIVAVWGGPRRRIPTILGVVALQGAILLFASPFASATIVALGAFGYLLIFPLSTASSQAIWQAKTPIGMQGRVFAFRGMVAGVSVPFAQGLAGPLADHVFEPAMAADGALAAVFGRLFGTGDGRGIALMLSAVGFCLLTTALLAARTPVVRRLEEDIADAIEDEPEAGSRDSDSDQAGLGAARHLVTGPERVATALRRMPTFAGLAALLVPIGFAMLILSAEAPPRAADDTTSPTAFAASRALHHLEAIAQRPHPTGSADHDRVRDYLLNQLEDLGLETMIQRQDVRTDRAVVSSLVTVDNVVARLAGAEGAPAVLLSAHYDSVPTSTGAADNAAGVAALIETARAMVAGERPRHDLIFLFTDAEEVGRHGAWAFVRDHPWFDQVAVAINLDARGHHGPVYMFQTGEDNGWWTRHLFDAVDTPRTSSFMHEVFRRLPNATDFNVMRRSGLPGFDLAMIRGLTHYHTDLDQPETVSLRSVQHHGAYALGLARHLGNLDLNAARDEANPSYFNVGNWVVHYPSWLARLLAVAVFLAASVLFIIALRRGRMTGFSLMQGVLTVLIQLVLVAVMISLLWLVVRDSAKLSMLMGSTEGAGRFMLAFAMLATALSIFVFRFLRRSAPLLALLAGSILWWLVLLVLFTDTLLTASSNFVALWPLAGALFMFGWLVLRDTDRLSGWSTSAVLILTMLPAIAIIVPLTSGLYYALQSRLQLSGVALLPLIMLLTLLTPHFEASGRSRGWWQSAALSIAGVALLGSAIAHRSPVRELSSAVFTHDADHDRQQWFSFDPEPSQWTQPLGFDNDHRASFSHFFALMRRPLLSQEHANANSAKPDSHSAALPSTRVEASVGDDGDPSTIRLTLVAPAGSRGRLLSFDPPDAVRSVEIDGTPITMVGARGPTQTLVRLPVRPREAHTIRLHDARPVTLTVVEQLQGLPDSPLAPRGPNQLPRPMLTVVRTDVTLVRRSFHLDPAADTVTPTTATPATATPATATATPAIGLGEASKTVQADPKTTVTRPTRTQEGEEGK